MSAHSKIQWCDGTVNQDPGCLGCELFLAAAAIILALDEALGKLGIGWEKGRAERVLQLIINQTFDLIVEPRVGHSRELSTTNIWHVRHIFAKRLRRAFSAAVANCALDVIEKSVKCYAAKLHLNKATSIANPGRKPNPGYAPTFEQITQFPGRMAGAAKLKDLAGTDRPDKPWLNGCRRLIFVSDMGDSFSRESDLEFLREDSIPAINSEAGRRHFWLWLTKRPRRMARFAESIGGFSPNVCAMTTLTQPSSIRRVDHLRSVRATVRGLSVEPVLEEFDFAEVNLDGIDWVILGGESGREDLVTPTRIEWLRESVAVCQERGVAVFVKQLGAVASLDGRDFPLKDTHGGDWDAWPEDLRVREVPAAFSATELPG